MDTRGAYHASVANDTLHAPNASIIPHLLLCFAQIFALASPPHQSLRIGFITVISVLAIYCNMHPHFTNNLDLAQPFSLAWSFYLPTIAKLCISENKITEARFWRVDRDPAEAMRYAPFRAKKIWWALALMFNQRGIRWSHQVKNVPQQPIVSHSRFLMTQVLRFCWFLCCADLCYEIHQRVNLTSPDGTVGNLNSKYLSVYHSNWSWSLLKTFSIGMLPYFMLSMQYALGGFLAVLFNFSIPQDWPPSFGSFNDLRTVRLFWGSFWHQQLRFLFTSYSDAIASFLHISRGSNLSSYTKLYIAFSISGTFHALGLLYLPRPSNIDAWRCSFTLFKFFILQSAAITLEDFIIWCGRRVIKGNLHGSVRMIGYVWVFCFMWWSLQLVGDSVLELRVGEGAFSPFPLMRPFVRAYVRVPL
ncbi:toxin biosynthesis protein [Xylaria bambusicola]|uniref:toxin biosynthesis protein n=1 Tax=Xylaria bambusicola TaxID=326684 RepID=UPI002007454F|nr:toxin biosynthesis protein [Xylaria bambusicola]KAI0516996.1 toxin biosynthesis protein [Xylaria bambusicola]